MSDNTITEHELTVSAGYITLLEIPPIENDLKVTIEGAITKSSDYFNHDGTAKRVYTFKGTIVSVTNSEGKVISE